MKKEIEKISQGKVGDGVGDDGNLIKLLAIRLISNSFNSTFYQYQQATHQTKIRLILQMAQFLFDWMLCKKIHLIINETLSFNPFFSEIRYPRLQTV